jgi:hypothetical protein
VYERSNPLGPSTRISQFSVARDPAIETTPCSLPFTQCVFDVRSNFPAQLNIPKIPQLDRYWHDVAILTGAELPISSAKR